MNGLLMVAAAFLPQIAGLLVAFVKGLNCDRRTRNIFVAATLLTECALVLLIALSGEQTLVLLELSDSLPIALRSDRLGTIFSLLMVAMWTVSGFFSFAYMAHEKNEKTYYAFYLLTLGALMALCFAATLVTMYLFFEAVTLLSLALVLHERSKEAIAAAIKYLIYSVAGATMGLLGIFFLVPNMTSQYFVPGGSLNVQALTLPAGALLGIIFVAIVGFSTKAGMFPMHGWLPTAHPVAPSPASAVLSGIITKAGVICVIRVIYYSVGVDFLRGTWVQMALLTLSSITVFMGSMMALNEKLLKKRLAFSSVSQVSYVLCGLFLLDKTALSGSLLHVVFHALIKDGLFLCAGAIIFKTGFKYVDQLKGLGRKMPLTFWCFTICSLGLIGIPPTGGFISKWFIAEGAIAGLSNSPVPVFTWLIPAVLLVSALLTAGYLMPLSIHAFFSAPDEQNLAALSSAAPAPRMMAVPLMLLAAAVVVLGAFPGFFIHVFDRLASILV